MTYSPGAFSHGGLQVARTSVQMDKIMVMPEQAGAEVGQAMSAMFGDDGFITYMATSDELWLGTGGAGADDAMRTMIDRVQKSKSGQGIEASAFAPFEVNAGAYFSMDFGRLFAGLKGILPEAEASEMAEVQEIMAALGAMTAALELQPDALALKFAMSTSGLAKIAELVGEEAAAEMEHGDGHGEGHDSN